MQLITGIIIMEELRSVKVFTSTKYGYDKMNRLTRVVAHDGTAIVITYDENGNRKNSNMC